MTQHASEKQSPPASENVKSGRDRSTAQKIRERLFKDVQPFSTEFGKFSPLPIILRAAQPLFSPRSWQIYTYVLMKAGQEHVVWFTLAELAWDLDFKSIAKLKPYVDQLVEKGWLCRKSSQGRDYYIAPDPTLVLKKLSAEMKQERREAIEDLQEGLKKSYRKTGSASSDDQEDKEKAK